MPLDPVEWFLSSRRDSVALETVEFSHPSFSKVYRIVRNANDGLTATIETGQSVFFDWYPLKITDMADSADLDSGIRIDFGDLGQVLPQELDSCYTDGTMQIKPTILYRVYDSDDLSSPMIGPIKFEGMNFSFRKEGASFEAVAPYMNRTKTGELYSLTRFYMLKNMLK